MRRLPIVSRCDLGFQASLSGLRALDDGRWWVSAQDGLRGVLLDSQLRIDTAFEFEAVTDPQRPDPVISINDAGTRAARAQWPSITVSDSSGVVGELTVPEGDTSSGTNVVFGDSDNDLYFVAPPAQGPADYELVCGHLDTGQVELLCSLPHFGKFTLSRPPAFPGIAISVDDGQNGSAAMIVPEGANPVAQVVAADRGFLEVSPSGDRYVDAGGWIRIGSWPGLALDANLSHDDLDALGAGSTARFSATFADESTVVAWPVMEPGPILALDADDGTVHQHYVAIDGDRPIPVEAAVGNDSQLLIVEGGHAYLTLELVSA